MAHSKFPKLYSLDLFSSSAPTLLPVTESEKELDSSLYHTAATKMELQAKKRTRLQRISSYLPRIITESKTIEDAKTLRKPAPAAHGQQDVQHAQHLSNGSDNLQQAQYIDLPGPGVRRPSAPPHSPRSSSANPPTSNRLRRHESPTKQHHPRASSSGAGYGVSHGQFIPPAIHTSLGGGRVVSSPMHNRNSSSQSDVEFSGEKISTRKSWLGGVRRSRNVSHDLSSVHRSAAWLDLGIDKVDYSLDCLVNGNKVSELWDTCSRADVLVYLFPPHTGRGPSFKVPSRVLESSVKLVDQIETNNPRPRARSFGGGGNLAVDDALGRLTIYGGGKGSPPYLSENPWDTSIFPTGSDHAIAPDSKLREIHLYFPVGLSSTTSGATPLQQDVQALVEVRNLFAFLSGQPLVATSASPTRFRMLLSIASLLWKFDFRNSDGSTYGDAASASFKYYLAEMGLADVRQSREKTIEGLILGERMRSADLYQEAFAHAVGKYQAVKEVTLFSQINVTTLRKLERAYLDLTQKEKSVDLVLTNFEFPSLFSGIANSTSRPEARNVNFKAWKASFLSMRKMILSYYKDLHGQWPPKASSKKNTFVEGGLNRLVLNVLYDDLCSLYDLLADRESVTTRVFDSDHDREETVDPTSAVLRELLGEYDRSSPPVRPPIPFDLPRIPTVATLDASYPRLSPMDQHKHSSRKLKHYELSLVLAKSHNFDVKADTNFLQAFQAFEDKESRGNCCNDLSDQRYGHWICLYAIIQTLPPLIVDAPGVQYSHGVEYFLCQPPMGGLPWIDETRMEWYGVGTSGGVVSLPTDVVNYGIEATYRRSHCWVVGEKWIIGSEAGTILTSPKSGSDEAGAGPLSPLAPPPGFAGGELGIRASSRTLTRSADTLPSFGTPAYAQEERSRSRQMKRQSIAMGLNRLPIPISAPGQENFSPSFTPVSTFSNDSRGTSPGSGYSPAGGERRQSSNPGGSPAGGERRTSSNPGSTFDDILKNMDHGATKKKK